MITIVRNTAIVTALFISTFITGGPQAQADTGDQLATRICEIIDSSPTPATIAAIGLKLHEAGANSQQAAQVIVTAVTQYCPENIPVLQAFINVYSPAGNVPSGTAA